MSSALHYKSAASLVPLTSSNLRMINMIGAGASGTVFRAELKTADRTQHVAVKVPHRGCDLRREASAMRRFPHPNVVSLVNEPANSSDPLIVELCNQGTLENRILEQPLQLREVVEVVSAIGSALELLHNSGWIHGDVTPSNIGLRSKGAPCLFDFGCARPADGSEVTTGTSQFCGDSLTLTSQLDVRSLAATAVAALGSAHESVRGNLDRFITRADDGELVTIEQLNQLLGDPAQDAALAPLFPSDQLPSSDTSLREFAASHELKLSSGGPNNPPRPRTREFGPRPEPPSSETPPNNDSEPQHPRSVGFLLLTLVLFGVLAMSSGANDPEPLDPAELFEQFSAEATLDNAEAIWSDHGVITVDIDGVQRTFAAGQRGDQAAIADWNCDGQATLGVYRPSTGVWFTFDTWSPATTSTVEPLHSNNSSASELIIYVNSAGCAHPLVAAT